MKLQAKVTGGLITRLVQLVYPLRIEVVHTGCKSKKEEKFNVLLT